MGKFCPGLGNKFQGWVTSLPRKSVVHSLPSNYSNGVGMIGDALWFKNARVADSVGEVGESQKCVEDPVNVSSENFIPNIALCVIFWQLVCLIKIMVNR